MPDAIDRALEFDCEHGGRKYRFRRPSVRQTIEIDVEAARLRGGLPASAMTYGVGYADAVAFLSKTCVEPKDVDFGALYDEELSAIYQEVDEWMSSFRRKVAGDGEAGGL